MLLPCILPEFTKSHKKSCYTHLVKKHVLDQNDQKEHILPQNLKKKILPGSPWLSAGAWHVAGRQGWRPRWLFVVLFCQHRNLFWIISWCFSVFVFWHRAVGVCSPGVRDHGPGWWALSRRLFSRTFLTNFLGVLGQFEDFLVPRVFRPRGMCLKKCQIVIREQNFFFSDFEVIYAPFHGIGHLPQKSLFGTTIEVFMVNSGKMHIWAF